MFREMRRKKQLLSEDKTLEILNRSTSGVLGLHGDNGYPYTIPLNHVYEDGKLFIHCAKEGHLVDSIKKDNKVSFTIIDQDQIVKEEITSYYRSVIIFGRARIVTESNEKKNILKLIIDKYSTEFSKNERLKRIEADAERTCLIEIQIDHMTGKSSKELVNQD